MTLDIAKFISNSIKTQAKIQHLDISTKTVEKDNVPESVSSIITKVYGKKYLLDSDYISFFWGGIDRDDIKKLFNVVDKALGKSANKLTDTDFKKIDIKGSESNDDLEDVEVEDKVEDEVEDIIDEKPYESFDAEEEIEDDDNEEETLNEDDDSDDTSPKPTAYFFLKITLK